MLLIVWICWGYKIWVRVLKTLLSGETRSIWGDMYNLRQSEFLWCSRVEGIKTAALSNFHYRMWALKIEGISKIKRNDRKYCYIIINVKGLSFGGTNFFLKFSILSFLNIIFLKPSVRKGKSFSNLLHCFSRIAVICEDLHFLH